VPYLTVVRGEPTDAELAAVITVLTARGPARAAAVSAAPPRSARSVWASRHRLLPEPVPAGPGAWRASARRW
jgi:hypothetical protein